jgi:DNA-binding NarL/FixJ family response regulator
MTLECAANGTGAGCGRVDPSWSDSWHAIDAGDAWNCVLRGEWVVTEQSTTASERAIVACPATPALRAGTLDAVEVGAATRRARGEAIKAIAIDLGCRDGVVHRLLASAMNKLKANHLADLVVWLKERPPRGLTASRIGSVVGELLLFTCPTPFSPLPACLTGAERAIVVELIAGSSQRSIARARGTSMRTVANQVASIFRKLDVGSRAELFSALAPR